MFDLAPWLEPLSDQNPSGDSLRDHPEFLEIERLTAPRADAGRNETGRSEAGPAPAPVDWSEVLRRCEGLRSSGRDLRLIVLVVRAHANQRGFAGLADGLILVERTIERHWDTLYPELRADPDPAEAAFRRLNALAGLQTGPSVLADLRARAAFSIRTFGPVTGADLERGSMEVAAVLAGFVGISEETRLREAEQQEQLIQRVRAACAALAEQAPDRLVEEAAAVRAAIAAAEALEKAVAERAGPGGRLADLQQFLRRVSATLDQAVTKEAPEGTAETGASEAQASGLDSGPAPAAGAAAPGRIGSREDVIRALDGIIEFYARVEPSSPVPFLARRMRRMVPMDFLQLIEDLTPGGLKEFRLLAGLSEDGKKPRNSGDKT